MSFFDSASLVQIPSGVKDGVLYSVKPIDGSGDLTFSRGSDIEATRVNANGYIEKAQVNLLLQSNTFSNAAWSITAGSSVTGGQSGYDGSNDAWLLTDSGFSAAYCLYQSYASSGVQTVSIYAKQGSTSQIEIDFFGGTGGYIRVELTDGSLHSTLNLIDYSVESVGGGWWRISFASNLSSTSLFRMGCNGGGSVYIQDAQINYGLVAQTYQETTTAAVVSGITDNMPRLSYDPANPTCPSLLLEPSRTNLVTNDSYYDGTDWAKTRCTIVSNTSETTSPEGVYNASKMVSNDASESYVQDNVSLSTSGVFSFFAKKGDLDYCHSLVWDLAANGRRQWFNLATGEVGSTTIFGSGYDKVDAGMEDYGGGWYRCWFAWNNGNTTSAVRINISSADADFSSPVDSYGYFYGCQVESAVSYPTSLIPTYGSSATRNADYASKSGIDSLIGQANGTLFFDFDPAISGGYGSGYYSIGVENGDYTNAVGLVSNSPAPTELRGIFRAGGSTGYVGASFNVSNQRNKIAIVYTASTIKLFKNGSLHASTSKGSFTNSMGAFNMTTSGRSGDYAMNQVLFFTSALSDAEAITLTSL